MVTLEYDRLLVVAVGLVTAGELGQMDLCLFSVIISNANDLGRYIGNGSGILDRKSTRLNSSHIL